MKFLVKSFVMMLIILGISIPVNAQQSVPEDVFRITQPLICRTNLEEAFKSISDNGFTLKDRFTVNPSIEGYLFINPNKNVILLMELLTAPNGEQALCQISGGLLKSKTI